MEFITSNELESLIDDTTESLLTLFKEHKDELIKLIGEDRYNRQLNALEVLLKKEIEEGVFQNIEDILDDRPETLKDVKLDKGFATQCGIKGSKLSGG